jgi:hypothetical protein
VTPKKSISGLAVFLLVAGQSLCLGPAAAGVTQEDTAVLRAVLGSDCDTSGHKYLMVSDKPVAAMDSAPAWLSRSLRAKLSARVPSGAKWPHIPICPAERIVDFASVNEIFTRQTRMPPGWTEFYARFPQAQGITSLSLPAFTPDRRHAVVYLETICGPLCGGGFYIEVTLGKAGWKVSRRANAWIS